MPRVSAVHLPRNASVKELPEDVFRVMPPDDEGPGRTCEHPPSVREFVWTGEEARADFKVGCRPGAQPGVVQCRARVVEGANVTCLSFHVEVVPPGSAARAIAVTDLQKLDVTLEKVRGNVAVIPQEDLEFHGALGEGIQVRKAGKGAGVCCRDVCAFGSMRGVFLPHRFDVIFPRACARSNTEW